jgi:hypothetical protein
MSVPDVDQELTRLLTATREGTAPDADARARVRAAVAAGLATGAALPLTSATRSARGIKWWLLSALGGAVVVGAVSWLWSPAATPATNGEKVSAPAVVLEAASSAAPAVSSQISPTPEASANLVAVPPSPPRARALKAEDPAAELPLVSAMQLALRSGDASQVLALATEHAQRFPRGALVQEREGARAVARCQLAEPAKRGAILSAFERVYASSPYAARVRAACAP